MTTQQVNHSIHFDNTIICNRRGGLNSELREYQIRCGVVYRAWNNKTHSKWKQTQINRIKDKATTVLLCGSNSRNVATNTENKLDSYQTKVLINAKEKERCNSTEDSIVIIKRFKNGIITYANWKEN